MKLLEIIQDIQLNEQLSRFLTKTLPSLGHTFEHNFFTELRRIIGKDLTTISPKEMSAAFKLPQMAGYRKQIADKLMETEFDVVDNILNKYNLSIPQQSINAGKELASTLDIDPAFLKDVKQSYLAKKGAGGTSQSAAAQTAGGAAQTAGGAAQPVVNAGGVISRNLDSNELIDFIVTNSQNFPILIGKDGKPIKQVMDQMPSYVKQFADRPIDEVRNEVIPLLDDLAKRITENKTIASEKKMAILKTIGSLKLGVRSTVRGIGVVLFSAILGDFIYKTYLGTKSTGNIAAGASSGALETGKDVYTGGKNFYNKATEQPQQQQQQQQPAQQKPAIPGASPTKTKKGWASNL